MNLDKELTKLLDEFGLSLVNDSRSSLKKKLDERAKKTLANSKFKDKSVKSVTSRLDASMKPTVSFTTSGVKFTFVMNDYWEVVENGRKAAGVSKDGKGKIAEWVHSRGVAEKIRVSDLAARKEKQSLSKTKRKLKALKKMPFDRAKKAAAFLVARKLKNKRLEPTNFFSEVIKDGRIEELKQKISELIKTDIIIDIRNGVNS